MVIEIRELSLEGLDALSADGLALFIDRNQRPLQGLAGFCDWRLCGQLSRVLATGFFEGKGGETLLMPTSRLKVLRLFAFGLGDDGPNGPVTAGGQAEAQLQRTLETAAKAGIKSLALSIDWLGDTLEAAAVVWARVARRSSLERLVLVGEVKALGKAVRAATVGDAVFQFEGEPDAPARSTSRS